MKIDLKEIATITETIVRKQKENRLFSLEKIISDVNKSLLAKQEKISEEEIAEIAIEEVADEVENMYKNGIESLLEPKHKSKASSAYMSFFLNCSSEFRKKFSKHETINTAIEHFETVIDYHNDPEYYLANSAKLDPSTAFIKSKQIKVDFNQNDISDEEHVIREKIWNEKKVDLELRMKESLKNQALLYSIFENFEMFDKILLSKLIERRINLSIKKLKAQPNYYCNNFIMDFLENMYYEFTYEDLLLIMIRMLTFITQLDIRIKFSEDLNLHVFFYAEDNVIDMIAQKYQYEFQLKNYGAYYSGLEKKFRLEQGVETLDINDEVTNLLIKHYVEPENIESNLPQMYELDESNVINYPPYQIFDKDKKSKYMRYTINDRTHLCQFDNELTTNYQPKPIEIEEVHLKDLRDLNETIESKALFDKTNNNINKGEYYTEKTRFTHLDKETSPPCCTQFRSIDRLRLIYMVVDSIINFKELINKKIFIQHCFIRDPEPYGTELSFNELCTKPLNVFDTKCQYKFIDFVRNYCGEKISFYFLFLHKLMMWMIIPALLGVCMFTFESIYLKMNPLPIFDDQCNNPKLKISIDQPLKGTEELIKISESSLYDILLHDYMRLVFCGLITIWATLFINNWAQQEAKYSYFWGTDNFDNQEPEREAYVPDKKERLIFDKSVPKNETFRTIYKTIISWFIILIMISITIILNILLLNKKGKEFRSAEAEYKKSVESAKSNFMPIPDKPLSLMVIVYGSLTSLLIKVMSFLYKIVTTWATDWENYATQTKYENSLALKFILFEFINNYFNLIYIAYFKRLDIFEGQCDNNDCTKELNLQLYIVLLTNLFINVVELGLPYGKFYYAKKKFIENAEMTRGGAKITVEPYSLDYQNLCEDYTTTMAEYIEVMILFGYICLFSVPCPLTPLIVMILLYFEKFVDAVKLFFLSRNTLLERADGIEIFRLIFKIIYFIGMLNSITYVLFSQEADCRYKTLTKIFIFAGTENLILILMLSFDFNSLPSWFENINVLRGLYFKKFFSKPAEQLPHRFLKEDKSGNNTKYKFIDEDDSKLKFSKNQEISTFVL